MCDLLKFKDLPPHKFEHIMMEEICDSRPPAVGSTTLLEIFVDDFIGATNKLHPEHLRHLSRAMLHGIHAIFPPTTTTGHCGADPISEGKLEKKEGTWRFEKEILGWVVDGKNATITLPQKMHRSLYANQKTL